MHAHGREGLTVATLDAVALAALLLEYQDLARAALLHDHCGDLPLQIGATNLGLALAAHFGDGRLRAPDIAAGLVGAVVKDPVQDRAIWLEYLETVVKERDGWKDIYKSCREGI